MLVRWPRLSYRSERSFSRLMVLSIYSIARYACLKFPDAWFLSMRLQVRVSAGSASAGWTGHCINVRRCGVLSMVLLQLKDPLELFVKRREFLPTRFNGFYLVLI